MSGVSQRSIISPKNKYYIPKYRYLELKNFCLQYPEWKLTLNSIALLHSHSQISSSGIFSDPTQTIVLKRMYYERKISMIDDAAKEADYTLYQWLIKGITGPYSYEYLKYQLNIPASRDMYYDRYRKFFWILDKKREYLFTTSNEPLN